MTVMERFDGGKKIGELIGLVTTGELTLLNAKEVMFKIVDGEEGSPYDIAKINGLLGGKNINLRSTVRKVIENESTTVNKIKKGKREPIKYLIGQVMK